MSHLVTIDVMAQVIRTQAWHRGDWGTVFERATRIVDTTDRLRTAMSEKWNQLVEEARNERPRGGSERA